MKVTNRDKKNQTYTSDQFVNAVRWLIFMRDIKNAAGLADSIAMSAPMISKVMKGSPPSEKMVLRIEKLFLKKYSLTLNDFVKPYLNNQAKLMGKRIGMTDSARLAIIEATQKEVLMVLKEITVLLKNNAKKK